MKNQEITEAILRIEISLTDNFLEKCYKKLDNAKEEENTKEFEYWSELAMRTRIEKETLRYLLAKYFD